MGLLGSVSIENFDCMPCQLGKQTALPFNNSVSHALSSFDLIHSDVWGPSPIATQGGSRYFVIFMDDFSRYTWIYLFKNRSELSQIYRDFTKMIETQFSKPIKVFRSDNAQEYKAHEFTDILHQSGTIPHSSCAGTSQQNGRAERKLRHILDVVHAITLAATTPSSFWGEAALTAPAVDPAGLSDSHALRRSHRVTTLPSHLRDFHCFSALAYLQEPQSFREASSNPLWQQAMKEELDALHKNGTWDLVDLYSGKFAIGCKWIYKIKTRSDGTVDRYKARVVARGFTQEYGIDYEETFAPVARLSSVMTLIAISAARRWPLFQMDVKNAFLNGELSEEVYMKLPPGYSQPPGFPNRVCRLRRALYGLKQAPRAWF